ncbi:ranBP-type and C3HC4-type zinc finger-containing protein 1-like isoform X2 [Hetaerina americana]
MGVSTNEGVTLRECLHSFCQPCLVSTIKFCEDAEVKCPYRDDEYTCDSTLQDREIRALIPLDLQEQLLARSIDLAEKRMGAKAFHCKTPDCKGWCVLEDNTNEFPCPVCGRNNCLNCQAIHGGVDCTSYQESLRWDSEVNVDQKETKETLQIMMKEGKAIKCPSCGAVIMKDTGCDWLCCFMCKIEICWITRGPRWGPKGNGDISGGCKCKVNGLKCHPMCNNCH